MRCLYITFASSYVSCSDQSALPPLSPASALCAIGSVGVCVGGCFAQRLREWRWRQLGLEGGKEEEYMLCG
jgi:hypothetical protein